MHFILLFFRNCVKDFFGTARQKQNGTARVHAGKAVQNQFGLYTGTASITLLAVTSNGTKLGGRTASAKEVAYTEYETLMKCIESAVDEGMKQMY